MPAHLLPRHPSHKATEWSLSRPPDTSDFPSLLPAGPSSAAASVRERSCRPSHRAESLPAATDTHRGGTHPGWGWGWGRARGRGGYLGEGQGRCSSPRCLSLPSARRAPGAERGRESLAPLLLVARTPWRSNLSWDQSAPGLGSTSPTSSTAGVDSSEKA